MSEKQTLIESIENGAGRAVRVHVQKFKGEFYTDIRIWIMGDDDIWKATQKGLCLHVELLPELIRALKRADESLEGESKS